MSTSTRAFQYALRPTAKQELALASLLTQQCRLYNAALEERRGAWRLERRRVTRFDQYKTLTGLAEQEPLLMEFGVTVARGTLLRLDRAFRSFFRRVKAGGAPGFPRYQSARRFRSVEWPDTAGWKLDESTGRLYLRGIGHVKVRLHRAWRGTPKTITVVRVGRGWQVTVFCVGVESKPMAPVNRAVGIDVGVTVIAALSDGRLIANPRHLARTAEALSAAQQLVSGRRRGSKRQARARDRVARLHRRIARQRRDFLHKQSRALVNDHDVIVIEDLPVANMVRRPRPVRDHDGGHSPNGAAAKAALNKSILDAGWGRFRAMLAYKAEEAGRQLVLVNPRYSSQMCPHCGVVDESNRDGTVFRCVGCGHHDHADVNAAVNILRAGQALRLARKAERTVA